MIRWRDLDPSRLLRRRSGRRTGYTAFPADGDIRADIVRKYGYEGDLLDLFVGNTGPVVHKWHHYIPIYDRYLARFRGTPVRMLEIGVSQGGSLVMWRRFLGPDAIIYGIDVDPDCARFDGQAGQVRIGSQADPDFLCRVVDEMGGVDVVLDDGSHRMEHVQASLEVLFPRLAMGGIYMIEDLHTAYWRSHGGGYRSRRSFFSTVRGLVDDMHRWYHPHGLRHPGIGETCSAIHVHDSIVVLEKAEPHQPVHSRIGG